MRYRSYIPAFCLSHILESRILSAPCSCTLSVVNSGILSDVCSGAFSQSLHWLRPRRVSSHQCVHSCPGRSFWKTTACNQTPLQQNLLNVQLESALQKVHFMGPGKVASWRTPEKAELSPSNNCESWCQRSPYLSQKFSPGTEKHRNTTTQRTKIKLLRAHVNLHGEKYCNGSSAICAVGVARLLE